jgi:hypothetical protein
MAGQVKALLNAAKQSGRQAARAARQGDASVCRDARNIAMQNLEEASVLAAQNQSCMDQTLLQRLNAAYRKADAIGCRLGTEQQSALVTVPSDSQVDRAREVAQEATAGGPKAKSFVSPQSLLDGLSTAARINASMNGGGNRGGGWPASSGPTTSGIPDNPLPGVIPSSGSSGSGGWTQAANTGSTGSASGGTNRQPSASGRGSGDCTIHYTGAGGDTYYVIDMGGSPKGFEIRRVYDPPRSDADRRQCGTQKGAMKKCIQQSYSRRGAGLGAWPLFLPFRCQSFRKREVQVR